MKELRRPIFFGFAGTVLVPIIAFFLGTGYHWVLWIQPSAFASLLGSTFVNWKKAIEYCTPYWVRYYQLTKYAIEQNWSNAMICDDPMNGCPEDFAEDHGRRMRGVDMQIEMLSNRAWKPGKWFANILLDRVNAKYSKEWDNQPWHNSEWNENE